MYVKRLEHVERPVHVADPRCLRFLGTIWFISTVGPQIANNAAVWPKCDLRVSEPSDLALSDA